MKQPDEVVIRCDCGNVRTVTRAEADKLASLPALGCPCGGAANKTPTK